MEEREILILAVVAILILVIIWLLVRKSTCGQCPETKATPLSEEIDSTHDVEDPTYVRSPALPVFLRKDGRIVVTAPRVKPEAIGSLPREYDVRKLFTSLNQVEDQGDCGSCWAFSSASVFSDRIKIATSHKSTPDLKHNDQISQFQLAACMKCPRVGVECRHVCNGHYMDEVMEYLSKKGCMALSSVRKLTTYGTRYICYAPNPSTKVKTYKSNFAGRINPYTIGELNSSERLKVNMEQIMYDINKYGPVTCTIRVFNPLAADELHKNFYLYEDGVYGHKWGRDPSVYDGYHALCIIGWGVDSIKNSKGKYEDVKYWILRNSWGSEWGKNGYGKIIRGVNRAIVESDIWAPRYDA